MNKYIGKTVKIQVAKCTEKSKSAPDAAKPWVLYEVEGCIVETSEVFKAVSFRKLDENTAIDVTFELAKDGKSFRIESPKGQTAPPPKQEEQQETPKPERPAEFTDEEYAKLARDSGFRVSDIEAMVRGGIIPKGTPPANIALFFEACRKKGLDPITKQIYLSSSWDKKNNCNKYHYIVSIEGFELLASRTGEFRGCSDPKFDGLTISEWIAKNKETSETNRPKTASIKVWRKYAGDAEKTEFSFEIALNEYTPPGWSMWKDKPFVMAGKTVEAKGLRKVFPDECGGLNIAEELMATDGSMASLNNPSAVDEIKSELLKLGNNPELFAIESRKMIQAIKGMHPTDMREVISFANARSRELNQKMIEA